MTKQKRKLIATFKGPIAEALHNDTAELTGTYSESKGIYELYMTMEKNTDDR
jgi:hypothetical protein